MIIAANWKMNLNKQQAETHLRLTAQHPVHAIKNHQTILFLPACYLPLAEDIFGGGHDVMWGAQDCHHHDSGAFTGNISAEMILGFGGGWALAGHSERRQYHFEEDGLIAQKIIQGLKSGLKMMLCVGESEQERNDGKHFDIVGAQVKKICDAVKKAECNLFDIAIAYEPVWAIGTGKVATIAQIDEMHRMIQNSVAPHVEGEAGVPVLYGGSVNLDNAAEIFALPSVNGALVGGASLDAEKFAQLCAIAVQK